jgi:predicted transposase YdaD
LLDGGFPKEKIRKALQFLAYYLTFDKPEISLKLKQEMQTTQMTLGIEELVKEHLKQEYLQEGIQKGEKIGIQKGEKIGIQIGIRLSIETMLKKGFEPAFIAGALSVEVAQVLKIEQALKKTTPTQKKKNGKGTKS